MKRILFEVWSVVLGVSQGIAFGGGLLFGLIVIVSAVTDIYKHIST